MHQLPAGESQMPDPAGRACAPPSVAAITAAPRPPALLPLHRPQLAMEPVVLTIYLGMTDDNTWTYLTMTMDWTLLHLARLAGPYRPCCIFQNCKIEEL